MSDARDPWTPKELALFNDRLIKTFAAKVKSKLARAESAEDLAHLGSALEHVVSMTATQTGLLISIEDHEDPDCGDPDCPEHGHATENEEDPNLS